MKKLKFLLLLAIPAYMGFMTSCSKDTNKPSPTVTFTVNGIVGNTATVNAGSVTFDATIKASAEIKTITLSTTVNGTKTTMSGFPKTSGFSNDSLDLITKTITVTANTVITVDVTDKNDQSTSATLTLTVNTSSLSTFTGVNLYAPLADGTNSNNCASYNGLTYNYNDVLASTTIQGNIDFIYFYDTKANIYAPNASMPSGFPGVGGWTTKNATKFALITTSVDWANLTPADVNTLAAGASASSVSSLQVGDYVAFITAAGKNGVFKVTGLQGGFTRSDYITIDVKVIK